MRPQGAAKIGAYPTPPLVTRALAGLVSAMSEDAFFRILDPCANDGRTLQLFAKQLKQQHEREHGRWADFIATTYGIEVQSIYAPDAEENVDQFLLTDFFKTTLSHGDSTDRGWQCLFLNPPYDDAAGEKGEKKERKEFKFLKRSTLLLCAHGILIFIIPQYVLKRPGVARFLAQHYEKHYCGRFPHELWRPAGSKDEVFMDEQFGQVVFIGRKRQKAIPYTSDDAELKALQEQIERWADMGDALPPIPLEGTSTDIHYAIPNAPASVELRYFLKGSFNPDAAAASIGQFSSKTKRPLRGVWSREEYWAARFPNARKVGLAVGHPLHKFKRGYLIVFAVAGLLNRAVLTGKNNRRVLVKGHTRKTLHYSCQEDEWEKIEKNTERYESSLWCTDLDTGDLILVETGGGVMVEWSVDYETMSMQDFLEEFGDSLMQQVMKLNAPRYQSARQVPWARQAFSLVNRKPLGKQIDIILAQVHALVNRWLEGGVDDDELVTRIAEIAEMASGKTYIAICTAFIADLYACGAVDLATAMTKKLHFFPAIVLTPPIMAPKWKRELELTLPNARVLIVERFGSSYSTDEDDEDDDELTGRQAKKAFSDASMAFRKFDPDFIGTALGTIGSVDCAVARIKRELADWQRAYDRVLAENQQVHAGTREGVIQPLPLKPCHVLVLTYETAKQMPQWMPVYQLKPYRYVDKESGKLKLLRRGDGKPVFVPCCASCGRTIKDERRATKELNRTGSEYAELQIRLGDVRRKRAAEGLRLGQRLNAYDEHIAAVLAEDASYQALLADLEAVQRELADQEDSLAAALARRPQPQDGSAHTPSSRQLRQQFERDAGQARDRAQVCQQRIERYLQELEQTNEEYARLLLERDTLRESAASQRHRMASFEEEAAEPVYLYHTEEELRGTKDHRVKRNCMECGEPLWQWIPKKPKAWEPFSARSFLPVKKVSRPLGTAVIEQRIGSRHAQPLPLPDRDRSYACVTTTYRRRWAIADYIADYYPNVFKFLIADETHEGGDGTALDQARQALTKACGRMIGLTGTLSNGYASSLFRLFYIIMRQVRQRYPYEGTRQWVQDHGKMQTVQKSKYEEPPMGAGSDSKRKIKPGMPVYREIAGFDPTGMGLVAQRSTLLELKDVVPNLVGYTEKIKFVDMGEELGNAYSQFESETTEALGKLLAQGDNSALSPWYNALLIYPDMPWLGWTCKTKKGILLGEAPALPEDHVYPIEDALIHYVQEQHNQGLPVLVYTENTGQYDDQERLKFLFETKVRGKRGQKLKVAILRSNTTKKTMDREAWLQRCVDEGVDVLICNPALVKVGLDLIYFKRIAYKRTPRKVSDLRQSSRRSLRPGQDTDVEVVFFAYEQSMALRLLHLMARKAQASLMVEGKIATEGLVSLGFDEEEDEGEIMGRMAREMLQSLKQGTLGDQGKMAEELQELTRQSIELEHRQNLDVGEEDLETRVVLEAITQQEVAPSASFYDDVTAPATASDGGTVTAAPAKPLVVTTVPLSVTDDPWAAAVAVQAAEDVWARLRQQLGPRKRGRRK